jgi:hypothetical protein
MVEQQQEYFLRQQQALPRLQEAATELTWYSEVLERLQRQNHLLLPRLEELLFSCKRQLDALLSEIQQKIVAVQSRSEEADYIARALPYLSTPQQLTLAQFAEFVSTVPHSTTLVRSISRTASVQEAIEHHRQRRVEVEQSVGVSTCPNDRCRSVNFATQHGESVCRDCGATFEGSAVVNAATLDDRSALFESGRYNHGWLRRENDYKNVNHFNEIMSRANGEENTLIHPNVLLAVREELRKIGRRLNAGGMSDARVVLHALRRSGFVAFYEHRTKIQYLLTDTKPAGLNDAQKCEVRSDFLEAQESFERCPADIKRDITTGRHRRNFLLYEYTMYQLCVRRGYRNFIHRLKLPKSQHVLRKHNRVWKWICQDLQWKFIPVDVLNWERSVQRVISSTSSASVCSAPATTNTSQP